MTFRFSTQGYLWKETCVRSSDGDGYPYMNEPEDESDRGDDTKPSQN